MKQESGWFTGNLLGFGDPLGWGSCQELFAVQVGEEVMPSLPGPYFVPNASSRGEGHKGCRAVSWLQQGTATTEV